jgi:transposase
MIKAKINKLDFTGQDIFIGKDVHKKNWRVCIMTDSLEHKIMTMDPKPEQLADYLKKNFPNGNYHCAYEAGFSGFGAHEKLNELGVKCVVVHPADVPTTSKEKVNKNDKNDCRKIARGLRNGELNDIYVPDFIYQEARSLVRCRYQFSKDQTRTKNRIKQFLYFYGIDIPEEMVDSHWSGKFIQWLQSIKLRTDKGTLCLQNHIEQLLVLRSSMVKITRQIRQLSREPEFKENIDLLVSVTGIGLITAMVFMSEIIDIRRFKNIDALASYIGIAPGEHSSGDKDRKGRITKRGNRYLRYLLVESAWTAVRHDPALLQSFIEMKKKNDGRKVIIKITRKLLNRMRFVLVNKTKYKPGVVSHG